MPSPLPLFTGAGEKGRDAGLGSPGLPLISSARGYESRIRGMGWAGIPSPLLLFTWARSQCGGAGLGTQDVAFSPFSGVRPMQGGWAGLGRHALPSASSRKPERRAGALGWAALVFP